MKKVLFFMVFLLMIPVIALGQGTEDNSQHELPILEVTPNVNSYVLPNSEVEILLDTEHKNYNRFITHFEKKFYSLTLNGVEVENTYIQSTNSIILNLNDELLSTVEDTFTLRLTLKAQKNSNSVNSADNASAEFSFFKGQPLPEDKIVIMNPVLSIEDGKPKIDITGVTKCPGIPVCGSGFILIETDDGAGFYVPVKDDGSFATIIDIDPNKTGQTIITVGESTGNSPQLVYMPQDSDDATIPISGGNIIRSIPTSGGSTIETTIDGSGYTIGEQPISIGGAGDLLIDGGGGGGLLLIDYICDGYFDGLSLTLDANPNILNADGVSESELTGQLQRIDQETQMFVPIVNGTIPLSDSAEIGQLGATSVKTNENGEFSTVYQIGFTPGTTEITATYDIATSKATISALEIKKNSIDLTKLTTNWFPKIHGDYVVWTGTYEGNSTSEIFLYNRVNGVIEQLTHGQRVGSPHVFEDQIAWVDYNAGITLYDIATGTKTTIGSSSARIDAFKDGKLIYWEFLNGYYQYDVATGVSTYLFSDRNIANVDFEGDELVYQLRNHDLGIWEIQHYNLETGEKKMLAVGSEASTPQIEGNYITWIQRDVETKAPHVFLFDRTTQEVTPITDPANYTQSYSYPVNLRLNGGKLVWNDDRNGNEDIYVYDIATGEETQVTSNRVDEAVPDIYEDTVVWYSRASDSSRLDIYLTELGSDQVLNITQP